MSTGLSRRESASRRRALLVVALTAGLLATLVLCLSDRAPGLIRDALFRWELADEVRTATLGFDPYLAGHFAIWVCLAAATSLALAQYPVLILPATAGLAALSIAIEDAQRRFTAIREFELQDIVANGLGIMAGAAVAVVFIGGQRVVAELRA